MAIQQILLGGYVDEEVAKINANFSECALGSEIPSVPTKVSDLENDSQFQTATQVQSAVTSAVSVLDIPTKTSDLTNDSNFVSTTTLETGLAGKVDKIAGKDLSTNDYTTADKTKVGRLGKIDFTASSFGTQQSDGYYYATLSAGGKYPVKVMRKNGSDYEEVLVHSKVSGSNIVICSQVTFEGYVVTM